MPDSGRSVCETYIFINSSILFYKNWKKLKTIAIALNKGILFAKKGFGTKR